MQKLADIGSSRLNNINQIWEGEKVTLNRKKTRNETR